MTEFIKNEDGTYSFPNEFRRRTFLEFLFMKPPQLKKISPNFIISVIAARRLQNNLSFVNVLPKQMIDRKNIFARWWGKIKKEIKGQDRVKIINISKPTIFKPKGDNHG